MSPTTGAHFLQWGRSKRTWQLIVQLSAAVSKRYNMKIIIMMSDFSDVPILQHVRHNQLRGRTISMYEITI